MVVSLCVKGVVSHQMRLLRCLKSIQPNKKSNKRDLVAFEKKSRFIVFIRRFCNLIIPVDSVGYIFVD